MFVVQHLLGHLPRIRNPKRGYGVCFLHCYPENIKELVARLEDYPAIVPMRPPLCCAASWKARQKDLELCRDLWQIMVEVIHPFGPAYLPIQAPDRDRFLRLAGERIDQELKTDWPVVASSGKTASLSPTEISLFREFAPFYDQLSAPQSFNPYRAQHGTV